ncbi:MAG: hypothetical protein IH934_04805 [Nanoarchaeota archaeon]|nr:hypothetical protein [Nanoarchaeota archaeon]
MTNLICNKCGRTQEENYKIEPIVLKIDSNTIMKIGLCDRCRKTFNK